MVSGKERKRYYVGLDQICSCAESTQGERTTPAALSMAQAVPHKEMLEKAKPAIWWLILQSLMFLLCSPPIVFAVLAANIHWQFTNTMSASVIGIFIAAVVTGMITHHVLGLPKKH
jgi:hypothetical protein